MNKKLLTESVIESLIGKIIIDVKENWIKLDNGLKIYLQDDQIDTLNDILDDSN